MTGWKVTEIDAKLMPPAKGSKWWPLYREIMLRLEETPERAALRVVLENGDGASSAMAAITRFANDRVGDGHVVMSWTVEDGQQVLYARRGPNYS